MTNKLHTIALLAAMAGMLALLGWLIAGTTGLLLAAGLGIGTLLFSPNVSPEIMMRLYRARAVSSREAPELHALLDALADRADLPTTPALYYLPTDMLNAMTVGRRDDAVVGVTDGLLRQLDVRELTAVLAHEIGHLANGDTRVMALADMISRLTSLMSSIGKLLLLLNLPLLLVGRVTISWAVILVLLGAPLINGLLQLALSRTREFEADRRAVELTGDPKGLAAALQKLEYYNASLLRHVVMPGDRRSQPSLLRTHPHTEARIEYLKSLDDEDVDRDRLDRDHGPRPTLREETDAVDADPRWRVLGLWY